MFSHGPRVIDEMWLYACVHAGGAQPIGYCSASCAHATPEEAEEHYRQYLLDSARFDGYWPGKQHRCEVCGAWTDRFAVIETADAYPLCCEHLTGVALPSVVEVRDSELEKLIESTQADSEMPGLVTGI